MHYLFNLTSSSLLSRFCNVLSCRLLGNYMCENLFCRGTNKFAVFFLLLTTARWDHFHRFHGQQPITRIQDQSLSFPGESYLDCYNDCILHPSKNSLACLVFMFDEDLKTCTVFDVPASVYEVAEQKDLFVYRTLSRKFTFFSYVVISHKMDSILKLIFSNPNGILLHVITRTLIGNLSKL